MGALKLIKGATWRDRIQNAQISKELNVALLLEDKDINKLHWYGHIKRMNEEKKPKQFLEWFSTSKGS